MAVVWCGGAGDAGAGEVSIPLADRPGGVPCCVGRGIDRICRVFAGSGGAGRVDLIDLATRASAVGFVFEVDRGRRGFHNGCVMRVVSAA